MQIILDTDQRDAHKSLMSVEAISKMCEKNSNFWIAQIKIAMDVLSKMETAKGVKVFLKPEQIIGYTVIRIAFFEKAIDSEIKKLKYMESVSDKITYEMLEKLTINIAGIGKFNLFQKALYIILAKLSENSIFNN